MEEIRKIVDKDEKIRIMMECDAAFPIKLSDRSDCKEIIQRVTSYALFYAALVECGGGICPVGYVAFYANESNRKTAYISNIGVCEDYQRNHIGSMLMEKCLAVSKHQGMEKIRLEVLITNEKAISFYKHWKFEFETRGGNGSSYMIRSL